MLSDEKLKKVKGKEGNWASRSAYLHIFWRPASRCFLPCAESGLAFCPRRTNWPENLSKKGAQHFYMWPCACAFVTQKYSLGRKEEMGNTVERREHQRKLLAIDARIAEMDTSNWTAMRLFDVSKAGIGFIHQQALEINKLYSIEFQLPDSDAVIACVAIALHCAELKDRKGYRIGARFVWITEHDAERITDYVWQLSHQSKKIDWT